MGIEEKDLARLSELNNLRKDARNLRQSGFETLKSVELNSDPEGKQVWHCSENLIEVSLVAKVQTNRHLSGTSQEAEAKAGLVRKLENIKLEDLFAREDSEGSQKGQEERLVSLDLPILVAARAMQALIATPGYAFSKASLLCYYRIVREIYSTDSPDWSTGGAKAGKSGESTAFVTGECIRAILAFERALKHTAAFLRETFNMYNQIERLRKLSDSNTKVENIEKWRDVEVERVGLAWYTSTDARLGEVALKLERQDPDGPIDLDYIDAHLDCLSSELQEKISGPKKNFEEALVEIESYRNAEEKAASSRSGKSGLSELKYPGVGDQQFIRSLSAHRIAHGVVNRAINAADEAADLSKDKATTLGNLGKLAKLFELIAADVRKVVDPARRFLSTVLDRELTAAAAPKKSAWDARELAFAAASYGAATDWRSDERLERACALLSKVISERGLFPAGRPFYSTPDGLRLHAMAFEVLRSFAQLLQRTEAPVKPKLVQRILYPFKENKLPIQRGNPDGNCGWHFEDPPIPKQPSVWVTSLAVLALDRIVRMLNEKINVAILSNFSKKEPSELEKGLNLEQLIYPDHGLLASAPDELKEQISWDKPVAIFLEEMRAHVLRTRLPRHYNKANYSSVFYGPPGTGKTTLLEALALSSNRPLVEISPSDIAVEGQEAIEARARVIFEALSMLTRVVIIFDEFEPVLLDREEAHKENERSIFTFLTPGMLPKLKKLHDAAKEQSVAYCLVTNHYERLDKAAIRKGRFDQHIAIYHPDVLSRTGTLMNTLLFYGVDNLNEEQKQRLEKVIQVTSGYSVQELGADGFAIPRKAGKDCKDAKACAYVVHEKDGDYVGSKSKRKEENRPDRNVDGMDPMQKWIGKREDKLKEDSLHSALKTPPNRVKRPPDGSN